MATSTSSKTSGLSSTTVTSLPRTCRTLPAPRADGQTAMSALARIQAEVGYEELLYNDQVGKVSLIGAGMRSHPGITATFFAALASAGVNIEMISTSEIRISVVTQIDEAKTALQAIHTAFGLDADGEAVVYAGTGR